ncbi:MAG: hypothetical protein ABWY05_07850 [Noviherbaspirillum sp.]
MRQFDIIKHHDLSVVMQMMGALDVGEEIRRNRVELVFDICLLVQCADLVDRKSISIPVKSLALAYAENILILDQNSTIPRPGRVGKEGIFRMWRPVFA